jgi:hypothetical protein
LLLFAAVPVQAGVVVVVIDYLGVSGLADDAAVTGFLPNRF